MWRKDVRMLTKLSKNWLLHFNEVGGISHRKNSSVFLCYVKDSEIFSPNRLFVHRCFSAMCQPYSGKGLNGSGIANWDFLKYPIWVSNSSHSVTSSFVLQKIFTIKKFMLAKLKDLQNREERSRRGMAIALTSLISCSRHHIHGQRNCRSFVWNLRDVHPFKMSHWFCE